jgi:hypothetical protein
VKACKGDLTSEVITILSNNKVQIKFRYSEKATRFVKISKWSLKLLGITSKKLGDISKKIVAYTRNIWTLNVRTPRLSHV